MTPNQRPSAPLSPRAADDDSIGDWVALHRTSLSWGALVVAVAIGGGWFYQRSQALKSERAEKAYYQGRQAAAAGNTALAAADLKKMAVRYAGTREGAEGRIYVALIYFDQKKFTEGLDELKAAEGSGDVAASVHALEGNGYEELKDFTKAAEHYRLASEASRFPADKSQYRAFQARALMTAGKRQEALAIWRELAKDEASPFALEAKLRIGELEASPAKA